MEDARRLASTAARLEHSKEEVGRQVGKSIISWILKSQYLCLGGWGEFFASSDTSANHSSSFGQPTDCSQFNKCLSVKQCCRN